MMQINDLSLRMVTVAGLVPWFSGLRSKWPFNLLVPKGGDKVGFGVLFGFAKNLIDRRTAPNAKPMNDMMQEFIKSEMLRGRADAAGVHSYVNLSLLCAVCFQEAWLTCVCSIAGFRYNVELELNSDTLPADLPSCIHGSSTGDRFRHNIRKPQLSGSHGCRKSFPKLLGRCVTRSDAHASTLSSPSKLSPVSADTICGYLVPPGTQVGANAPGVLRSQAVFGSDADCFRQNGGWRLLEKKMGTGLPA